MPTAQPNHSLREEPRRPSINRAVSDNMVATASPTPNRAPTTSNRSSTFGSLFRTRPDAIPQTTRPPSQYTTPQQQPRPYGHDQLPPPLPNPYDNGYNPATSGQQRPNVMQHRPHSSATPQSHQYYGGIGQHQQQHQQQGQPTSAPAQQQRHHTADTDELQAVLAASRESAAEDHRKRDAERKAEEDHYRALHESELAERARQEAEEEERMLVQAMEASMREEQEAHTRRLEKQREEEEQAQLLLEESRQSALREEERRTQREHAALLEQSRMEAEAQQKRITMLEQEEQAMEQAAIRESLKQMDLEWQRREEAERAVDAYMQHGGVLGGASYWQHLDHMAAYNLAVKMDKKSTPQTNKVGPSSRRRPLPPTPGMAALAAGLEAQKANRTPEDADEDEVWLQSDDEYANLADEAGKDPFSDDAEAPPTYDEVREDRPPEAPETIPANIRFASQEVGYQAEHSNTLASLNAPSEKSAAYAQAQEQATNGDGASTSHRRLPPVPLAIATGNDAEVQSNSIAAAENEVDGPPISDSAAQVVQQSSSEQHEDISTSQAEVQVPATPSAESTAEFMQRTMKGTDFGYSSEPFGTDLRSSIDAEDGEVKTHFPNSIQLRKLDVQGTLREPSCFFVVRAPSWKALLRALAWYGNTRLEAGPEEIADYADGVPLRVEVEFVTPPKAIVSAGVRNAHVGVCISLAVPSLADTSSNELRQALKQSSRALDASCLRQGSTRRVIALPSQAPTLPLDMVRLAQHMHRAHTFSAACPSTGATALHSPRDLHHAVERHDAGFVAKMQRKRKAAAAAAVQHGAGESGGAGVTMTASGSSGTTNANASQEPNAVGSSSNGHLSVPARSDRRHSTTSRKNGLGGGGGENEAEEDGEEGSDEDDILDAGAVEVADGTDRDPSRMSRMRARVRRRLGKRAGDSRAADEDLESWISKWHSGEEDKMSGCSRTEKHDFIQLRTT